MYTLINALPIQRLLVEQLPIVAASLLIAEFFYKFRSFTLEAIAFFITWYVLELVFTAGVKLFRRA